MPFIIINYHYYYKQKFIAGTSEKGYVLGVLDRSYVAEPSMCSRCIWAISCRRSAA